MPQSEEALSKAEFLRTLILGYPKTGKSTSVLLTCEKPVYVVNCDQESSLLPARRLGAKFEWDYVATPQQMESAILTARNGVKAGKYRTVVLDTITNYARHARDYFEEASRTKSGEADGRRFWDALAKNLLNVCDRFLSLRAHVLVLGHYAEVSAEIEGQIRKTGDGVVPLIQGAARNQLPGLFDDVIFFEKKQGKRYFVLQTGGRFGPGTRSLNDDIETCDADIGVLWNLMRDADKAKPSAAPPAKKSK